MKPQAPPVAQIPDNVREFWNALVAVEKKELSLLAEKPHRNREIEAALGLSQRQLMGRHSRVNRLASKTRTQLHIRVRGRGRAGRKYWVSEEAAALIRELAMEEVTPAQ
jgi:hypothetical protein